MLGFVDTDGFINSAKMTGFDLTTDWPKEKMMALLKVRDSLKVDC